MPFTSKSQAALCYSKRSKGQAGSWDCEEWADKTDFSKLPEKAGEDLIKDAAAGWAGKLLGFLKSRKGLATVGVPAATVGGYFGLRGLFGDKGPQHTTTTAQRAAEANAPPKEPLTSLPSEAADPSSTGVAKPSNVARMPKEQVGESKTAPKGPFGGKALPSEGAPTGAGSPAPSPGGPLSLPPATAKPQSQGMFQNLAYKWRGMPHWAQGLIGGGGAALGGLGLYHAYKALRGGRKKREEKEAVQRIKSAGKQVILKKLASVKTLLAVEVAVDILDKMIEKTACDKRACLSKTRDSLLKGASLHQALASGFPKVAAETRGMFAMALIKQAASACGSSMKMKMKPKKGGPVRYKKGGDALDAAKSLSFGRTMSPTGYRTTLSLKPPTPAPAAVPPNPLLDATKGLSFGRTMSPTGYRTTLLKKGDHASWEKEEEEGKRKKESADKEAGIGSFLGAGLKSFGKGLLTPLSRTAKAVQPFQLGASKGLSRTGLPAAVSRVAGAAQPMAERVGRMTGRVAWPAGLMGGAYLADQKYGLTDQVSDQVGNLYQKARNWLAQ